MIKKKSLIICIFVSLFIILAILLYNLFNMFYKKTVFENDVLAFWNKNQKTIFSINKCVFFTSCNAKNKTSSNTNFTIENLYQYTDIALFINNNSEENNLENIIQKVETQMIMHSLMYKTEILKENGIKIDEKCFYTDTEYAIFPLFYAKTIKIYNIPLYVYRIGISGQSISFEGRIKHHQDHEKVDKSVIEKYKMNLNITQNLKKYIEMYMMKMFCGTINNFLLILPTNKAEFNHIKEFDKQILELNPEIYNQMEKESKCIKLLRTNNYFAYLLCHLIRKSKLKK